MSENANSTKSKITPDHSLDWMDAPISAKKWKNLIFAVDGKSYLDTPIYNTESEALSALIDFFENHYFGQSMANVGWNAGNRIWILTNEEYSHAIQIPWRDE